MKIRRYKLQHMRGPEHNGDPLKQKNRNNQFRKLYWQIASESVVVEFAGKLGEILRSRAHPHLVSTAARETFYKAY